MKIYLIKEGDSPEDIGIVLEGTQVRTNLGSVAKASSILLGLTYVFQKLDNSKLSSKVQYFLSSVLFTETFN
uniref:Uncharacterized protein n=1 Tax=Erpetoichthys calabaricus TaxID=27687 RepID=A0A8C4TDD3_ERPCA